MKKFKKLVAATLILSGIFATTVSAETQVFVNGTRFGGAMLQDGKTYVPLREISTYVGYSVEYDDESDVVNFYKIGEKPVVRRETSLFPTKIDESENGNKAEIRKFYELSSNDNPKEISKESFEKNGFKYDFVDVTKNPTQSIDSREYTKTVSIKTSSKDVQTILGQLDKEIEHVEDDGAKGILKLDTSSIKSSVAGYDNSTFTVTETRVYPNLSSADTSLVPKTITQDGRTLALSTVSWQTTGDTAVDYNQLSDSFKATAIYTRIATRNNITGYITTANYVGDISKTVEGKTIYTAFFNGTKIEEEPTPTPEPKELTAKELKEQLKEKEKAEKLANKRNSLSINPMFFVIPLILGAIAACVVYILKFRKNVTVMTLIGSNFQKIGKTRVTKSNPVIDLTGFKLRVVTPSFILVLDKFVSKGLNGETVTINYGDNSFGHTVVLNGDGFEDGATTKNKKDYQIEVDF